MIHAISSLLGYIIRFFYYILGNNYFLTILVFTFFTKVILFPLSWGQIRSMEKMNKLSAKQKEIQDKYKNDKNKQSEELMKLYKENKVNPMSSCLPLIIQIPIILAMFYIVRQPLTYIVQTSHEDLKAYTQELLNKDDVSDKEINASEIIIAKDNNLIDMQVVPGINLGDTPRNVFSKDEKNKASIISLIIPILAVFFSFLQIKLTQKSSSMSEEQAEMQKTTNLMMPLLSGFISFSMPLALGIYWLFGNILQIIQQLIINKIVRKDKEKILALEQGGEK